MLQIREQHRIAVFVNWHWRVNRPLYYCSLSLSLSLSLCASCSLSVANERTTLVRFVMELGFGESTLARVSIRERKRERESRFLLAFSGVQASDVRERGSKCCESWNETDIEADSLQQLRIAIAWDISNLLPCVYFFFECLLSSTVHVCECSVEGNANSNSHENNNKSNKIDNNNESNSKRQQQYGV